MRRSGVRNFSFDIEKGLGTFLPAEGKPLDFASIQEAVKMSGFPLLWSEAAVEGQLDKVTSADGQARLSLTTEMPIQVFYLKKSLEPAEASVYSDLERQVGKSLRLRGRLQASADGQVDILVKTVQKVESPTPRMHP